MTPHDPRFTDLLPGYAAGALDPDELAELERHLEEGCERCLEELAAWSDVGDALGLAAEPIPIRAELRQRVLGALDDDGGAVDATELIEAPPANDRRPWLAVAAGLALLSISWAVWTQTRLADLRTESERRIDGLEQALERSETELGASRQELAAARAAEEIVASSGVRTVALRATAEGEALRARSYADPDSGRAVVFASNLPPVTTDQTFQLWLLRDGAPFSAGVFEARDGSATVLVDGLEQVEGIQGWAVSIEPAGGSEQPTGPIVLSS